MAQAPIGMVELGVFETLQAKIDEDVGFREKVREILQALDRQNRVCQFTLAKAHSTPNSQIDRVLSDATNSIYEQKATIDKLAATASKYPYYKYNGIWSRHVQSVCEAILLTGWLGGSFAEAGEGQQGRLLTIEEVGQILAVPVNLKDRDAFHLTIEEYLFALISLIDELTRLAVNSVTLGDYERPLQISQFVKDIHAGFQILNLKNSPLRVRSDSIKYSVKKVEDVVYDLSLRNLIPRK